ncbi:YwiC-like family protein [Cellulomonas sp. P22]|uniref:YwiC-like family protein n=1 Tax=Cellulomonas sp. P22 TaxID=3373189 RepID=UPI003799378E
MPATEAAPPRAPRAPRSRRRGPGWVPNQHGAWAMLVAPFVVGALDSGPTWRQVPLLLLWLTGYLAFFAAGLWLRSRCKGRYWPPVRTYGVVTAALGAVVVALAPELLRWVPVYLPLLAVSLWCSWRRADRTYLNDGVTIVAACLMTVVVTALGSHPAVGAGLPGAGWLPGAGSTRAWLLAAVLATYFGGTVLYVKTLIRDRGDARVWAASAAYHVVACVAAFLVDPWVGALFAVLAVRAAVVPRRWPGITPARIGAGEVVATITLAALLLVG